MHNQRPLLPAPVRVAAVLLQVELAPPPEALRPGGQPLEALPQQVRQLASLGFQPPP